MELIGVRREYVRQKLYRTFRIKDEEYIITLKLLSIYRWAYPIHGDKTYTELAKLRLANRQHSNKRTVDFMYEKAEAALYERNGRFAPRSAKPPQQETLIVGGWKVA